MRKKITFDDGSSIEWCDRETLKYEKDDRSCLVWVDYFDDSLLCGGRLVHEASIKDWNVIGTAEVIPISGSEKLEILNRIKKYYEIRGVRYRIEP